MDRPRASPLLATAWLALAGAVLAGCNDPSVERGTPPALALNPQTVTIGLYGYGAALTLRSAIAELSGPNGPNDIRATIETASRHEADTARARLIAEGIQPTSIRLAPTADNEVVLARTVVTVPDCVRAMKPALFGDVSNSLDSLGRCVAADTLAQSAVDPADLVQPVASGPTNGAVAARAVLNWERGNDKQQSPQQNAAGSGNGADGADSGGGAEGGASGGPPAPTASGPATTTSPSGNANPLLAPGL